jgi:hypothetical protein
MSRMMNVAAIALGSLCMLFANSSLADDEAVCPKYALEWVDMNSPTLKEVDALLARTPSACPTVRRKIEDYRKGIAKAPNPVLESHNFRLELTGCTRKGPGAECTATVTAKSNVTWFLTGRDRLVKQDGSAIPVSSMSVGGYSVSFGAGRAGVNYVKIEAGLSSQITFRFDAAVEPDQVQALVVAVGAQLSGRTSVLSPIPWR